MTEPSRDLSPSARRRLALEAWEALFRAQATLAREYDLSGDWGGFPAREYGVLYALTGTKEGVRITELMDDALLSQAGVSRLVARLEDRGLVERRDDPADARACLIRLTEEGRATQRKLGRMHARDVNEAMTRALTDDQLSTLLELSQKLVEAAPPPGSSSPEAQRSK